MGDHGKHIIHDVIQESKQRTILFYKFYLLQHVFLDLRDFRNDIHTDVRIVGEKDRLLFHEREVVEDTLPASCIVIRIASGFQHPMG